MDNVVNLDVLVVYSSGVALSASVEDSHSKHPFLLDSKQADYNRSYAYFLDACKKQGMKAGFTTSADIIGPGMCKNYWTSVANDWTKIDKNAKSFQIFDKISPVSKIRAAERKLLLASKKIMPFNDIELFAIFFDKLLTYKTLSSYAIPTVEISSNQSKDINIALQKLTALISKHSSSNDFSHQVILKDRFGAGGNHVYKVSTDFSKKIHSLMIKYPKINFVIQPFLKFDQGYTYQDKQTSTDIRLIFQHNQVLQYYLRIAKPNDFRCNEHQGGRLVYVTKNDIPESIHLMASKIIKKINKPQSLYALDFAISNTGKPYFIEGNVGPGIDWNITKKIDEKMSKQLIRSIVKELASRVHKHLPVQINDTFTSLTSQHNHLLALNISTLEQNRLNESSLLLLQ